MLQSFAAPPAAIIGDREALNDRVAGATSGLLGLVGIDADPLTSREHILIGTLLGRAWREGYGLDLPTLSQRIQKTGLDRIGVMGLESVFPAADRLGLAMRINNLLASLGFEAWAEGEPLDVGRLLFTAEGRPRLSIVSIAHLTESERTFLVTTLLNEVLTWVRSQPGSRSLRAILYMDEIFGFMPPVANPPSKRPLLALLKQARAQGLGVVLATQNPVDLDYKGLSNTGTWFLGRLQTERDKARVIDGLEGASADVGASFDCGRMERLLAGLDSRVFLLNNVHEDELVVFKTRWALSYLSGPLTREQIRRLSGDSPAPAAVAPEAGAPPASTAPPSAASRPTLPDGVVEPPLETAPVSGAGFYGLPAAASNARTYDRWRKMLTTHLYRHRPPTVWRCRKPKLVLAVGEDHGAFVGRLREALREQRDLAIEKLRWRYAPKLARIQDQIPRAEQRVEV